MSFEVTRRQFILQSTVTLAGAAGVVGWAGRSALAAANAEKPLYVFPLLGDLHYDLMSHHDMEWVKREKPNDIRQIEGYVDTSTRFTPKLMAELSQVIAEQGAPVPFVVHIGDFVEGLCGSYDLQALQFRDAIAMVTDAELGAPFLMTKGNHDITGPGAPEAYDEVLVPWLATQARKDIAAAFFVKHDEDLFVYFDAYRPDLDWLEKTLADHPARHVFFVVHPPVVPYNARANWIVFANEDQRAERERLLGLLGKYRALVLSGHLHKYSLLTRRTPHGSFTHLAVLSVLRNETASPRDAIDGVGNYTADLVNLEPRFSPGTVELRRQMLEAEKPFIDRFEFANVPGYAMVKVYADRVEADIYVGLGRNQWKSRDLLGRNPAIEA